MYKSIIKQFDLEHISNVLIVGDNNYFISSDIEVEMISQNVADCTRLIKYDYFIRKSKRPLYYKYDKIIIEQKYLNLLREIKHYFNDKNFCLCLILEKNYQIEYNDDIIDLLKNKSFNSKISNEFDDYTLVIVKR